MKPYRRMKKFFNRLLRLKERMFKKLEGFTLIEMILVATLVVILSTLAIASMRSARNKGYETGAATGLKAIAAAQEMFLVDNGRYAGGFSVLPPTYLPSSYASNRADLFIKKYSLLWRPPIVGLNPPGLVNIYSLNTFTVVAQPVDNALRTFMITDQGAVLVNKAGVFKNY